MTKQAAIYARVSSDRQKEDHTIGSQTAALIQYAETEGFTVPKEWVFQDEGYRGASIVRPGLEAIRDLAAEGHIQAVLIHSPDRLSRKYGREAVTAPQRCLPSAACRGVLQARRGDTVCQGSLCDHAGGATARAVSGNDRRV